MLAVDLEYSFCFVLFFVFVLFVFSMDAGVRKVDAVKSDQVAQDA